MKKRIFSILLMCCTLLSLLPINTLAASGPKDTIPDKYDVVIDLYNRTSDVNIGDSKTYYIYSSVPDNKRAQWTWEKKIQINGKSAAPHIFIDGVTIETRHGSKTPAIEVHGKATAYLYFIGRDSLLQGTVGRAAIQKNRSEGQVHVLVRTGTTVTCKGGEKAAGIGGSYATRNIFDGLYNRDMYGHGVNLHFGSQTNPDYWDGTIVAKGGEGGAGIGGGRGGSGEKLYFYSGTVNANGGRMASGIGGSYEGRGSEIHIYDGEVNATGGDGGAGIGGGCWKTEQAMDSINAAHDITISGGYVNARGGYNGAGIGGGQYVPAHDITITGGYVAAHGVYGAGIGGGRWTLGKNITVTDATLKLSAGRFENGSNAAAMGYGDLVYKPEKLTKDPSIATNDAIKIGSKEGKMVMVKVEAHGLTENGTCTFFWNLFEFLIPNENGRIDVQLLTLPYVQNYGWTISKLEMLMMDTSCEGDHTYGWTDRRGCHVWACTRCLGRNPLEKGPVPDGKHTSGDWEGQIKKCTVCGYVTTKDTTPPVFEGLIDGWDYSANDSDDGLPGSIRFTVSDPAGEKESSSGVKSVTINGVEQTGPVYQLAAPDGGNNDEGSAYEVVATDYAGNSTTAKVSVYRRHRVLVVEDRNDLSKIYIDLGIPHGMDLDFPLKLPEAAYLIDLDNENIIIPYQNGGFHFGVINSNRTFLLVIPKTELPDLSIQFMRSKFWSYHADDADEFCYANPVYKGEDGYSTAIWVLSDETSYYFGTSERYTMEQLKALDESGSIAWRQYHPEHVATLTELSSEDSNGEWYIYAKATNEVGTKYISSPRLIVDGEPPVANVYPTGQVLAGLTVGDIQFDGTTYWGGLQFTATDNLPFTVKDGTTVLEPDENGVYTIPADMDDHVYHHIYVEDACGNKTSYMRNKVRWNTLDWRTNPDNLNLSHGAVLTDELPKTVAVRTAVSGMKEISVPVIWEIPAEYDPASKREQSFTVTGTLDLSGTDIVVNPKKAYWQNTWVNVTVAGAPQYTVTANHSENGSVTVTNAADTAENGTPLFCAGDWVMLSAVPDEGYLLKSLTVVKDSGESVVCAGEDEAYSFIQPGENVTVNAVFEEIQAEKPTLRITGEYIYDGTEQVANVAGYDSRTMKITGHTGTDAGDYTVCVTSKTGQWTDGTTDAVTAVWRIEKAEQDAPTGLTGITPTTMGGSDGRITGVDETMEYRAEGESVYTVCSGTEIVNLSAGNYFVRYAADQNHFASPETKVTVDANIDCRITFDANGGSGTMEAKTVQAGTACILPECGFTAPDGQVFKAWEIGGSEYAAGARYTVNEDTVIKALWKNRVTLPATYTVIVINDGNGTGFATPSTAEAGTEITLSAVPNTGYHFKAWQVVSGDVTITGSRFTLPEGSVVVKAIFETDPPAPNAFTIEATAGVGGSISPAGNVSVRAGGDQTFTITPDTGYTVSDVLVDGQSIGAVLSYSFEHVAQSHTIAVSFAKTSAFVDVPEGSYYEDAVDWAVENGITKGTDSTHFSPDGICTRAQAVTFLWRAAGCPAPKTNTMSFTDVPADSFYYDAVLWAVENGITKGTSDTTFSPGMTCSRAQIATLLWRSEKSPAAGTVNPFTDVKTNAYYTDAVLWAVKEGITKGTSNTTFSPDADCTRAEIVTFLWRCKK